MAEPFQSFLLVCVPLILRVAPEGEKKTSKINSSCFCFYASTQEICDDER